MVDHRQAIPRDCQSSTAHARRHVSRFHDKSRDKRWLINNLSSVPLELVYWYLFVLTTETRWSNNP